MQLSLSDFFLLVHFTSAFFFGFTFVLRFTFAIHTIQKSKECIQIFL